MSSRAPLDTPNWHGGRRFEYLGGRLIRDSGCQTLDIGGTTLARAPVLCGDEGEIVAPDLLAWRGARLLGFQMKFKLVLERWRGGSPLAVPRWAPRDEIGIDRTCWQQHLDFERRTGIPVVLAVLVLETSTLSLARLTHLPPPRPSPNANWPLVNWNIASLRPVWHCDPQRLRRYFFWPDGRRRDAPADAPSAAHMQQVMDYLQGTWIEGAMDDAEQEWLSAMVPA